MTNVKRKLIEVALPLEAINRASKAEKDRKVGKPQQIHHWWARRPIVTARAMLFAQLVDDPSSRPSDFPTLDAQEHERARLFRLLERLVQWEAMNDPGLIREARREIANSFDGKLPTVVDPFAGGGSIPLEAQRLGLPVRALDLNPVAVLINRALVEFPARFNTREAIHPRASQGRFAATPSLSGLVEDVGR